MLSRYLGKYSGYSPSMQSDGQIEKLQCTSG